MEIILSCRCRTGYFFMAIPEIQGRIPPHWLEANHQSRS